MKICSSAAVFTYETGLLGFSGRPRMGRSRFGFKGTLISGTIRGAFLDDPKFAPLLAGCDHPRQCPHAGDDQECGRRVVVKADSAGRIIDPMRKQPY